MYKGLGCGDNGDCGCGCKKEGVGFLPPPAAAEVADYSDSAPWYNPASWDVSAWDWHQWLLAAIAVYAGYRIVKSAVSSTVEGVRSTGRRARKAVSRRKTHLREAGRHARGALFG